MSFEQAYYEADSFWAGHALLDPGNKARINATAKLVPDDVQTLLDVGCGNGVFGKHLRGVRPSIEITGVDRSAAALSHVPFEKREASIDALPFDDHSFDCVTCLQVVEHLPQNVYPKAIAELARVATKYVVLGVPFEENLENEMTTCPACRTRFNMNLHFRSFGQETLEGLFRPQGGRLISTDFPTQRIRPRYVNEIARAVRRESDPGRETFLSPICPLCGYTEGDKTALSINAEKPPVDVVPGNRSIAGKIFSAIEPFWPKEKVPGYWVIALYAFNRQR